MSNEKEITYPNPERGQRVVMFIPAGKFVRVPHGYNQREGVKTHIVEGPVIMHVTSHVSGSRETNFVDADNRSMIEYHLRNAKSVATFSGDAQLAELGDSLSDLMFDNGME